MKPLHVLIVDDESDFRATLNLLLSMEGFQVTEAPSGDHAIKLVDAGLRPDVLLLDYRMPGLNGGQTLGHMRSQALDAPAVLITAASDAHDLARQHGFNAVLQKPVGTDALLATLVKVLAPR
jgi:CheY-like chemotaxis protein